MPSLPKWLANTTEKLLKDQFHPVEVTGAALIAPELKRVTFSGNLSKTQFQPGQVIEFRINETDFRHYTPSVFDIEKGICEVLFYLHGKGPGSSWAANLK
ncbi:MAG: oxidoreductase, partial [Bacteroidota bacterium]